MLRRNIKNQQGYAIIIVLVLLVTGTVLLVMFNRENAFFSKVSGFFNRNRKIQEQARDGVNLAKSDLRNVAFNSRDAVGGADWFTEVDGSQTTAFNEGLYADPDHTLGTRTLTPRITRNDGDVELKVYYFPDDPCINSEPPCTAGDTAAYNEKMPKLFHVVSQATNTKSGEIYTQESRIQMKLVNYAEYSLGVLGQICLDSPPPTPPDPCVKPFPSTTKLDFSPAYYGRSYFNIDPASLRFVFEGGAAPDDKSQQHFFNDIAEFPLGSAADSALPFEQKSSNIKDDTGAVMGQRKPMLTFTKGFTEGEPVIPVAGGADYDPAKDPSTDEYFATMQAMADSNGHDFTPTGTPCPAPNALGVSQIDVCLKFEGTDIKQYDCKKYNNDFMGRVDMNIHPDAFTSSTATTLQSGNYDRYVGEHQDVYSGTDSSTATIPANGVIYCHLSGCDCNVHIKGILDGQVTIAATNAVIEGDLVYQDQDPEDSDDVLGVMAKKDIIIPAGLPQAATSEPTAEADDQQNIPLTDADPPFNDTTPGGTPATLAESYLDITNFIPQKSGAYVDRDLSSENYAEYVGWDTTSTGTYNSPMVLDLDAQMYAGNSVKMDAVFNPEIDSPSTLTKIESLAFITCENATGPSCAGATEFKYRNPAAPTGEANALFNADGSLVTSAFGVPVQPYFWVDGLNMDNGNVDGHSGKPDYANFTDTTAQLGEEVARPMNRLLNVFGGINSKYYYIYDQKTADNGDAFRMGFRRKIINGDPRSSFLTPPGYPSTLTIDIYDLYQKSYQGKSPLIP